MAPVTLSFSTARFIGLASANSSSFPADIGLPVFLSSGSLDGPVFALGPL